MRGVFAVRVPEFRQGWGGAGVRTFSSGMYGFRNCIATEREPLNYKIADGKFPKIALVKFFTKSETPWLALISRF
jgi:hypothetical protein